eukprot:scaffold211765_cov30-Tisochrysis_lutea.AAC.5
MPSTWGGSVVEEAGSHTITKVRRSCAIFWAAWPTGSVASTQNLLRSSAPNLTGRSRLSVGSTWEMRRERAAIAEREGG